MVSLNNVIGKKWSNECVYSPMYSVSRGVSMNKDKIRDWYLWQGRAANSNPGIYQWH